MKALMKTKRGVGNIELQEILIPHINASEVLIRVQIAGVCGTDVHIYYDRFANSPPLSLGHEFSGIVTAVGKDVKRIKIGDRVVSANNPFACGSCKICSLGFENLCENKRAMGIHSDGCFADYVALPKRLIHKIPENVSFEEAALMEPLAVAVHAVANRCKISQGDFVVVFGAGAIGILAAQVARAESAKKVLIIGTSRDKKVRFKSAEQLGFETLNAEKENVHKSVMSMTDGVGADVVIEASGSRLAIVQAIEILRKSGRMSISGITGQPDISLPWDKMVSKGVSLYFAYSSVHSDWEKGLNLLSEKKIKVTPLITRYMIGQWKEAFDALEKLEVIKPIFQIGAKNEKRSGTFKKIKDIIRTEKPRRRDIVPS